MRCAIASLLAILALNAWGACDPPYTGCASLTWTAPTQNVDGTPLTNLAGYRIYRDCGSGQSLVADVLAPTQAYSDDSPPVPATCAYRATAYNALGEESAQTNPVSKSFALAAELPGPVTATFTWQIQEPADVALAFAQLTEGNEDASDGNISTASVSPSSGAVLYFSVSVTYTGGLGGLTGEATMPTPSGLSATWTVVARRNYADRRTFMTWRGVGATGSGAVSMTGIPTTHAGVSQSYNLQDVGWILDEVTGADGTTPNDAAQEGSGSGSNLTLSDVGTVDAGDAVYVVGAYEDSSAVPAATGFTEISKVGALSNVRWIFSGYDDSTPDETPEFTGHNGSGVVGFAFVVNAGAGGGVTLAAESGSYTLTGAPASLVAGRKLTAEAGALALSGAAANLTLGTRKVIADGAPFALAGSDASLVAARDLAVDGGAFVFTGTAATLTHGSVGSYTLTADGGAFALSGADAGLTATRLLAADAGIYALAGAAAQFVSGKSLAAAADVFRLTGSDVSLQAARLLTGGAGAFVLSGADATLTYGQAGVYTLTAASGRYEYSGAAAQLVAALIMQAASGGYALTGADAALGRGFTLAGGSGAYTLIGTDIATALTRLLSAASGSFVLAGANVTLTASSVIIQVSDDRVLIVPRPTRFAVPSLSERFVIH